MKSSVIWIVAFVLALFGAGCGGSGGGSAADLDLTVRNQAITAIETATAGLTYENFDANAPAALAAIKARPEVQDAQIMDGDRTIWLTFTDGRIMYIVRNRVSTAPLRPDSAPLSRAPGGDIPGSPSVALYYSFGAGFADATKIIWPWISARGYNGIVSPTKGTVEDWKTINGQGLIYVDSHGASGKAEEQATKPASVMTATIRSDAFEKQYAADLAAKRLIYFNVGVTHYAITSSFVKTYLKLNTNSYVFLNCCKTFRTNDLFNAFTAVGASAYSGWTDDVEDGPALDAARFVFDRYLGNNAVLPALTDPVYPEDWATIASDITTVINPNNGKPYNLSPLTKAILKFASGTGSLGSLTPTVKNVFVSQADNKFNLDGVFGTVKGSVFGLVGTQEVPLTLISWGPNLVSATYNSSVTSVFVKVNNRISNVKQISAATWQLTGINDGPFTVVESIIVSKNGTQLFAGSGANLGPVVFTGTAGELLHVQIKTTKVFGGSTGLWIKPPKGASYQVASNTTDFIADKNGVAYETDILLTQP